MQSSGQAVESAWQAVDLPREAVKACAAFLAAAQEARRPRAEAAVRQSAESRRAVLSAVAAARRRAGRARSAMVLSRRSDVEPAAGHLRRPA